MTDDSMRNLDKRYGTIKVYDARAMVGKEAELENISLDKGIDISLNRNNKEMGGIMCLEYYTVTYFRR
jgi:hypothetical protein